MRDRLDRAHMATRGRLGTPPLCALLAPERLTEFWDRGGDGDPDLPRERVDVRDRVEVVSAGLYREISPFDLALPPAAKIRRRDLVEWKRAEHRQDRTLGPELAGAIALNQRC